MKTNIETVNMKKQYRDELKTLKRSARKIKADWRNLNRARTKTMKQISRELQRGGKTVVRELLRIEKRQAILQGRLS